MRLLLLLLQWCTFYANSNQFLCRGSKQVSHKTQDQKTLLSHCTFPLKIRSHDFVFVEVPKFESSGGNLIKKFQSIVTTIF